MVGYEIFIPILYEGYSMLPYMEDHTIARLARVSRNSIFIVFDVLLLALLPVKLMWVCLQYCLSRPLACISWIALFGGVYLECERRHMKESWAEGEFLATSWTWHGYYFRNNCPPLDSSLLCICKGRCFLTVMHIFRANASLCVSKAMSQHLAKVFNVK